MIYYKRTIENTLAGERSENKVRLIFGARQTGKSTLLLHVLPGEKSVLYNLQDSKLRRQFEMDPASLGKELRALEGDKTRVVIDEIQKVPALLDEIQFLYDTDPNRWQFFLTGSSARRLRTHSANLLPGRCHVYHLYPVTRLEEAGFDGLLEKSEVSPDGFPDRNLENRLTFGNLPGVLGESPERAAATLEAYVENYLEEEIRREAQVRDMGAFGIFLRLAAGESGKQTNLVRLSQESGVPAATLRNYYQVLVDTFVGYSVAAYGHSGRKRLLTTPRFLLFDLGVRHAAARMRFPEALTSEEGGKLLEHWVGLELIHRAGYKGRSHSVAFWRTTTGAEVDYIWQTPEEDVPIEVKWSENPRAEDVRHLETFLDLYPERAQRGLLVCRIARPRQVTDRIQAIPWSRL